MLGATACEGQGLLLKIRYIISVLDAGASATSTIQCTMESGAGLAGEKRLGGRAGLCLKGVFGGLGPKHLWTKNDPNKFVLQ